MSAQGGSAGGGGGKDDRKSIWTSSKTSALTNMLFLCGTFFIGFRVDTESSVDYTTIFIIELMLTEWMSPNGEWEDPSTKLVTLRECKKKVKQVLTCRVYDMFQHPTNPKWIVVVTSSSVIIFEFDETSMSLKQICELKGSENDFQCICSAHMSRDGRTLMLWTFNQVRKHEERHVHRGHYEVVQTGIKSHCVRFFRLVPTGSGYRFSPEPTYAHLSMQSVEDHFYTGPMPQTYLSQDGSLLFVLFRTNILVFNLGSHSLVHVFDMNTIPDVFQFDEWGRIKDLQSMTVVSNQTTQFLVLLSSTGLITILQFDSDHPEQGLEFKSRYESPKKTAECSSMDLSTYRCIAYSSHKPLHFFVGGSTCGSSDGVIRLYKIDLSGHICLDSEEKAPLAVYEIQSKNGVTCALSKHFSADSAYLHSRANRGGIVSEPCHLILDTRSNPPPPSQSTLNGAPIGLPLGGVFAVLPGGAIVASNTDKGLTLFGPDGKKVTSTDSKDAHKSLITSVFSLEVGGNTFVVTFSHSDGSIKIWSIQKRGETVRLQIVATVSTADLVQKKGVKFLALDGQTLLIVTNKQEFLRFHIEITGGIRAEIRLIPGPVVQMESGQICQRIAAVSRTHALIYVASSGVRGCSLVLVSLEAGAAEMFKTIGTREAGKSPAALTPNGFAVSAVVGTTVNSSALAPGGASCSFNPMEMTINSAGQKAATTATILALASCEGGFIYLTEKGSLIRITYSDDKPVVPKKIAVLKCSLTQKCWLQVSGNTAMVCQPRDDGSFELLTFQF
jgi:WD40 repeat protein